MGDGGGLCRFLVGIGWFLWGLVIGRCVEYCASDGQDVKSVCRVLFTGLGFNSGIVDCK